MREMTKQPSQLPDRGDSRMFRVLSNFDGYNTANNGDDYPDSTYLSTTLQASLGTCSVREGILVMNPRELDLTFNPFEDDSLTGEPTPQNRQYFGSAFLPNATIPTPRRRSSFGSSNGSSSAIRKRHARSRTEFEIDIPEPEISGHPLKSAALRSAAFQDFDITRPNLSRIVQSTGVLRRSRSQEPPDSANRSSSVREEVKEVIIHEVSPHTLSKLIIGKLMECRSPRRTHWQGYL